MKFAKIIAIFGISVFSCMILYASQNPFMINANQRDFQAQQNNKGKKHLTTESVQLPSNARELKSVTLTFQNLDGTTESKQLKVDKTIDWHYPIKITQQEAIRNISKRYFSLNDFEFYMEGKTFVINSPKHRILRHFLLANPTTIVVDFSRDKGAAYDGNIGTGEKYYAKVGVNAKSNLYRVSIELDGIYQYTLKSAKNNTHTIQLR
ncbi:AMIN domain-containing protein [Helicobacter bilis]|uniref:AMIN domain-containing protein n=2 Tax=Helicobacter bilis TaxID=37372 RepID=UPI00248D77CA|nr:AMIN domain-containing protein [Helicobacter bilis]